VRATCEAGFFGPRCCWKTLGWKAPILGGRPGKLQTDLVVFPNSNAENTAHSRILS
jgi:hypothetical protein